MSSGSPATIKNMDSGDSVTCTFRPKELTMTKQNTWTATAAKGKDAGQLEFGGGGNAKLELELLFDTSAGTDTNKDVRTATQKLWKMAMIEESTRRGSSDKARPPFVKFEWGKINSFKGVIESINQKFILFNGDGTPVRAVVTVSLTQFEDDHWLPQNPTSGGTGGHKVRVVRDGETLDQIAYEEYGDPNHWRKLAQANGINNPLHLTAGKTLGIPPLI